MKNIKNMNKQRFLINCTTSWCGTDNDYPALAEKESDLYEYAEEIVVNNLLCYMDKDELAEELGILEEDYESDADYCAARDEINIRSYCDYTIESFTGTDEEWNSLINDSGVMVL